MQTKSNLTVIKTCLLAVVLSAAFMGCREEPKKAITTEPITFTREGELEIYRGATDSLLTRLDIEIAESDYEIETGLMYREKMDTNQAMLFIFPDVAFHSFYMKNTLIPLDIIFIDEGLNIVNIRENASPLDESGIPSGLPVQYVLEVNAGLSETWGIQLGDRVVFSKQ